jgi:hypothetical protein
MVLLVLVDQVEQDLLFLSLVSQHIMLVVGVVGDIPPHQQVVLEVPVAAAPAVLTIMDPMEQQVLEVEEVEVEHLVFL